MDSTEAATEARAAPDSEQRLRIGGIETLVRRNGKAGGVPTIFCHGNPTHSADWIPFLERLGGPGIAFDLPCFGAAERPDRTGFDASMSAYAEWVGAAIDELAPGRFNLVVHDWGGIALRSAQDRAERLERLVVINAVPLTDAYRWHWVARIWRRRGLGELFNAITTKQALALLLRQARPGYAAMPREFVQMIWDHFDRATRRAVLALYRSADPAALGEAGAGLDRLDCPALVLWGREDPYIDPEFAADYAQRLPGAELELLEDAGHWPWIDRPEVGSRVVSFLAQPPN